MSTPELEQDVWEFLLDVGSALNEMEVRQETLIKERNSAWALLKSRITQAIREGRTILLLPDLPIPSQEFIEYARRFSCNIQPGSTAGIVIELAPMIDRFKQATKRIPTQVTVSPTLEISEVPQPGIVDIPNVGSFFHVLAWWNLFCDLQRQTPAVREPLEGSRLQIVRGLCGLAYYKDISLDEFVGALVNMKLIGAAPAYRLLGRYLLETSVPVDKLGELFATQRWRAVEISFAKANPTDHYPAASCFPSVSTEAPCFCLSIGQ